MSVCPLNRLIFTVFYLFFYSIFQIFSAAFSLLLLVELLSRCCNSSNIFKELKKYIYKPVHSLGCFCLFERPLQERHGNYIIVVYFTFTILFVLFLVNPVFIYNFNLSSEFLEIESFFRGRSDILNWFDFSSRSVVVCVVSSDLFIPIQY